MNSSFCPNCGQKVNESDSQFCINCGYNLSQNAQVYNNVNPNVNAYNYNNVQPVSNNSGYSNGMGITGFVISLISLILCCGSLSWLSLIFSIIGINKAKKNNGAGQGLSLAGLIISIIGLLIFLFYFSAFMVGFMEGMAEAI